MGWNRQESQDHGQVETILAISPQKKSALILCKDYYAEFLGPGAAIAPDEQCRQLVFIGAPRLIPMTDAEDCYKAYKNRLQWIRWLQKISQFSRNPLARSEHLLSSLEAFFGAAIVRDLDHDILAQLIGVFPQTIIQARYRYLLPLPSHHSHQNLSAEVSYWEPLHFNHALAIHSLHSPQKHLLPNTNYPSIGCGIAASIKSGTSVPLSCGQLT